MSKEKGAERKRGKRTGRQISVVETDFYLLDVMQDPDFKKHFLYRLNIAREKAEANKYYPSWYVCYNNDPDLFLFDLIEEAKRILGLQKASCLLSYSSYLWANIVMPACSDYICEKTGQPKPFERMPNSTSQEYNFDCYYANPNRKNRKTEPDKGGQTD